MGALGSVESVAMVGAEPSLWVRMVEGSRTNVCCKWVGYAGGVALAGAILEAWIAWTFRHKERER